MNNHVAPDMELQGVLAELSPFKSFPLLKKTHEYNTRIILGFNATSDRPMGAPTEGPHSPEEDEADDDGLKEENLVNLGEDSGTSCMKEGCSEMFSKEHRCLVLSQKKAAGVLDKVQMFIEAPWLTVDTTEMGDIGEYLSPPSNCKQLTQFFRLTVDVRIGKELRLFWPAGNRNVSEL
ncbi:hypothetical protein FPOAC1_011256 [Fusarium poae]|uniref:hypothetical protein n=1 Tax=Fusarium poae TaxID=36050 RepID=UPI001CE73D61|nr:hypothetical protein FPOAC1_011256 [Fusarium poae]KAG8666449.1 hypothetical protein FPOAC1_011256 [Fusarium poae]